MKPSAASSPAHQVSDERDSRAALLVELHGIEAAYDGVPALSGLSLSVRAGEGWAVLGPNGSGKSTLLRVLLGLLRPSAGTVRVCGHGLPGAPPSSIARDVAWVPQVVSEDSGLTVLELALMGCVPHLPTWSLPSANDVLRAERALAALDMGPLAHRALCHLSGGERRRAWLARALVQEPRLLLMDEPTAFLDLRHQVQALALVRRRLSPDFAFVAALHDPNLAARFATHAALVREGRLLGCGPVSEVLTASRLSDLYGIELRHAVAGDELFVPCTDAR